MAFKAAGHLLKSGYLDGNLRPLLQNEVGYHIGAEEDDSSIEMVIECSITRTKHRWLSLASILKESSNSSRFSTSS